MSEERIATFEEFWPFYVREHAKKLTRTIHFIGTTAALAAVATAIVTRRGRFLALAPLAGYSAAWFSHFFVEENRPATFKYPLWSLRGDLKMWGLMVAGEMDAEIERITAEAAAKEKAASEAAASHGKAPGRTNGVTLN